MQNRIQLLALCALSLQATVRLPGQTPQWVITYTDLNPAPVEHSYGYGVAGEHAGGVVAIPTVLPDGRNAVPTAHAAIWFGTADSLVDLHPRTYASSSVYGTSGEQQTGFVDDDSRQHPHAALWSGTADSFVDLNPSRYAYSCAYATSGGRQVGTVESEVSFSLLTSRAALWSGSADSFVELHPAGANASCAYAISGNQQAGWVRYGGKLTGAYHAAIWSGTAESFVDLHPVGAKYSIATGTSGNQQAGYVTSPAFRPYLTVHAAIWSGSANSLVDLNPTGAWRSQAFATTGRQQVGNATFANSDTHAGIWFGMRDSFLDLHAVLDSSRYGWSDARAVWTDGFIIKVVGTAMKSKADGSIDTVHAILWTLAPPDTTPPLITRAWASQEILWPPNHRMIPVQLDALVEDNSGKATWKVIGVRSNEPESDARDIEILSDTQVNLRVARCANGTGRVYTILLQAADAAGNLSEIKSVQVVVRHDARRR